MGLGFMGSYGALWGICGAVMIYGAMGTYGAVGIYGAVRIYGAMGIYGAVPYGDLWGRGDL